MMEAWGNSRGKAYYEAAVPPDYPKPRDGAGVREIQRWIRDKYEKKLFLPRDGSVPAAGVSGQRATSSSASREKCVSESRTARPTQVSAPVAPPAEVRRAPAPVAAAPPAADLLSFDAFAADTAPPVQQSAAPVGAVEFASFQNGMPQQPPPPPQQQQPCLCLSPLLLRPPPPPPPQQPPRRRRRRRRHSSSILSVSVSAAAAAVTAASLAVTVHPCPRPCL